MIFAHVEPLRACATLKLYQYIEKTKWKLCYVFAFQFSNELYKKLTNVLNPKILKKYFFILKKSFVIPFKSRMSLEKESEIKLVHQKFPGS